MFLHQVKIWMLSLTSPNSSPSLLPLGFLEKNRDVFSKDLIRLLNTSQSALLKQFFKTDFDEMVRQPIQQNIDVFS